MLQNRLKHIRPTQLRTDDRHILHRYKCSCGRYTNLPKRVVDNGNTRSCGCLKKETSAKNVIKVQHLAAKASKISNRKHGMRNTRFYRIWGGMKARCYDKRNKNYGRKGIKVCKRWSVFTNFMEDMYDDYVNHLIVHGEKNTSIDRVDGSCGYSKDNCRWATRSQQRKNIF